jgi:hypothetical protein
MTDTGALKQKGSAISTYNRLSSFALFALLIGDVG